MYSGVRSEFPLHVEQVLNGVGRPAIVDVGQDERSDDQGSRAFQATERTIPVQPEQSWFSVWFERVYEKRDGRRLYVSHRTVHGPTYGPDRQSVSDK